ncbi:MAG: hypothetical protein II565_12975, partial [Fibrobacter sp.]|nr:hypothetical protein [Fibrobacter sp.]
MRYLYSDVFGNFLRKDSESIFGELVDNYHGEKISYKNVPLSTETFLTGIRGRTIDMTVNVRPANGSVMYHAF